MNPLLRRLLGVPKVQALLRRLYRTGPVVWSKLLEDFNLRIEIKGLENLHALAGQSIVVVANHPHGLLETFIVGHVLVDQGGRRDVRFFANEIIGKQFQVLMPHLIPVRIMGRPNPERFQFNQKSMQSALQILKEPGSTVMIFPGGNVSSFKLSSPEGAFTVTDSPWKWSPIRLMREANVRIVPLHVSGRNSLGFHFFGAPAVLLRRLISFHEFMRTRNKTITVTIGKSLGPEDFVGGSEAIDEHILQLRKLVYALPEGS